MKRLLISLIVFIVLLGVAGCSTSRTSEFSFSQVSLVSKYRNDCKEIEEFFYNGTHQRDEFLSGI